MKLVARPGHTKATVTRRTAPFGIARLHALHRALPVCPPEVASGGGVSLVRHARILWTTKMGLPGATPLGSVRMLPLIALPAFSLGTESPGDQLDDVTHSLSRLIVDEESIGGTGKRKVDGSLAATRLGQTTSQRWANERFRQTMLLILEFRREWPGQSMLTPDDVDVIRTAIDNALASVTASDHKGDIYDSNPTCWAIWLVQRAHSLKAGGWTAESTEVQQRLFFKHLYEWLQAQHSRRQHSRRRVT